ncbi:hypothetical protein RB595_000880 [Gaeumannomyces hyphopodioides]
MSLPGLGGCPKPFLDALDFTASDGFVKGRLCSDLGNLTCCLPCPMTEWVYPDTFDAIGVAAEVVAVVSTVLCAFLLLSWFFLPVEKTHRHYLSICLTIAVIFMNMGFVVPFAAQPEQCADKITPNDMKSNQACAASGSMLILGGWGGVMWVFLRALSLHLQICWQVVVGKTFMWFAQAAGWGIPLVGIILALTMSGVSFRFGQTCHVNHENSLAVLWIPLLIFSGFTIFIQLATFIYCIKVYLASLNDNSASTEGSNLPSSTRSIQTMTPRQAYRRVRRVIQLQWRGIAIVLIIVADVIFFSIVYVFQDNTLERLKTNKSLVTPWVTCLALARGDKNKCLDKASELATNQATVGAVLVLLAMNGVWLMVLLGRWSMITGWKDLFASTFRSNKKAEFVSVDARVADDFKNQRRSYEMLSRDSGKTMVDGAVTPSAGTTPISPYPAAVSPASPPPSGRRTPDYFGQTARYHAPTRSFSKPKAPPQVVRWDNSEIYAGSRDGHSDANDMNMNPLGMNRI